MNKLKKNLKISGIAIIFSALLSGLIYFNPPVLAVSAEKGNFAVLGREIDKQFQDEMIDLMDQPGSGVVRVKVKSGKDVLVLDKANANKAHFYLVATIGKGEGMIGWVGEEYIYKIVSEPKE